MTPPIVSISNALASFQAIAFFSCLALLLSHLSYDDTLSILLLTMLVIFFGFLGVRTDSHRHVVATPRPDNPRFTTVGESTPSLSPKLESCATQPRSMPIIFSAVLVCFLGCVARMILDGVGSSASAVGTNIFLVVSLGLCAHMLYSLWVSQLASSEGSPGVASSVNGTSTSNPVNVDGDPGKGKGESNKESVDTGSRTGYRTTSVSSQALSVVLTAKKTDQPSRKSKKAESSPLPSQHLGQLPLINSNTETVSPQLSPTKKSSKKASKARDQPAAPNPSPDLAIPHGLGASLHTVGPVEGASLIKPVPVKASIPTRSSTLETTTNLSTSNVTTTLGTPTNGTTTLGDTTTGTTTNGTMTNGTTITTTSRNLTGTTPTDTHTNTMNGKSCSCSHSRVGTVKPSISSAGKESSTSASITVVPAAKKPKISPPASKPQSSISASPADAPATSSIPSTKALKSPTSPKASAPPSGKGHAVSPMAKSPPSSPSPPTSLLLSPKYYQVKAWLSDVSKVQDILEEVPQAVLEGSITVRKKLRPKPKDETSAEAKAKAKGKGKGSSTSHEGLKGSKEGAPLSSEKEKYEKSPLDKQASLEHVVDEAFKPKTASSKSSSYPAPAGPSQSSKQAPLKPATVSPPTKKPSPTPSKVSQPASPKTVSPSPSKAYLLHKAALSPSLKKASSESKAPGKPDKVSEASAASRDSKLDDKSKRKDSRKESKKDGASPPKSPHGSKAGSKASKPASQAKASLPLSATPPATAPSSPKTSKPAPSSPKKPSPPPSCGPSKGKGGENKANKLVDDLVGDAANQLALEFPGLAAEDLKIDLASLLAGNVQTFTTTSKDANTKPHQDTTPPKQPLAAQPATKATEPTKEKQSAPPANPKPEDQHKVKDKKGEDDAGGKPKAKDDVSEKLLKGFLEWRMQNGLGFGEIVGAEGMKLELDLPTDAAASGGPSQDKEDDKAEQPKPTSEEDVAKAAEAAKAKMKSADARLLELAAKLNAS